MPLACLSMACCENLLSTSLQTRMHLLNTSGEVLGAILSASVFSQPARHLKKQHRKIQGPDVPVVFTVAVVLVGGAAAVHKFNNQHRVAGMYLLGQQSNVFQMSTQTCFNLRSFQGHSGQGVCLELTALFSARTEPVQESSPRSAPPA